MRSRFETALKILKIEIFRCNFYRKIDFLGLKKSETSPGDHENGSSTQKGDFMAKNMSESVFILKSVTKYPNLNFWKIDNLWGKKRLIPLFGPKMVFLKFILRFPGGVSNFNPQKSLFAWKLFPKMYFSKICWKSAGSKSHFLFKHI